MTPKPSRPVPSILAALVVALLPTLAAPAGAQPAATPAASAAPAPADAHRRDDVARHRAIAAAHEAAARCLEAGRKEADCQEALRKACQGIAVGRYCGMKHGH